jgi:hypothetical protein
MHMHMRIHMADRTTIGFMIHDRWLIIANMCINPFPFHLSIHPIRLLSTHPSIRVFESSVRLISSTPPLLLLLLALALALALAPAAVSRQ